MLAIWKTAPVTVGACKEIAPTFRVPEFNSDHERASDALSQDWQSLVTLSRVAQVGPIRFFELEQMGLCESRDVDGRVQFRIFSD